MTLTTTGDVVLQELRDATAAVGVEQGADGATWTTATLPAGTELHVSLSSPGEYTLDVASAGLPAPVPDEPLPVTAELRLSAADVAAYTEFGQRVTGTLHVTGAPDEALSLALDATTTHPDVDGGARPDAHRCAGRWDRRGIPWTSWWPGTRGRTSRCASRSGCVTMPAGRRRPPRTSHPGAT